MSQHLHHLTIPKTARIATYGQPQTAQCIWLVLHGYGQLLPYFIRPFQALPATDHFVIAPEGLSRFYLKGTAGRVGASWMTREDRLTEINDQAVYLDQVQKWAAEQIGTRPVTWIGFGFSQGVATLNRWLANRAWAPRHIVNWAGSPPWDISYAQPHLQAAHWWYHLGKQDEYIPMDSIPEWVENWAAQGIHPTISYFAGTHEIPTQPLQQLATAIQCACPPSGDLL